MKQQGPEGHMALLVCLAASVDAASLRATQTEPACHSSFDAPDGTSCPHSAWVDAMVKADPTAGKVILDIGCNKGQDMMRWMERFDMSSFWSTKKWLEYYSTQKVQPYSCHQDHEFATAFNYAQPAAGTHQQHISNSAIHQQLVGVCVEPMQASFDMLRSAAHSLGYGDSQTEGFGDLHIVQAAVTDKAAVGATVGFPDRQAGAEAVGIPVLLDVGSLVPLKTVDGLVAELALPKVDILLIDTEGADPSVLRGSVQALKSVRYLEFEVHRDYPDKFAWGKVTLRSVVNDLDIQGFDCYWAGENGRLLSMNRCWNEKFERGTWSNAACVKRGDVWDKVVQSFAD